MSFILRIILAFLVIFILEFYFRKKIITAVVANFSKANPKILKRIFRIFLLYINIYPIFLITAWLLSGQTRVTLPEGMWFHYLVIYPFWVSIILIIQSFLILFPIDIVRWIFYPFYKKHKIKILSYQHKVTLTVIGFFILYVPGRIIYDYYSVSTRIKEFKVENLHPNLQGLKIALIADIQADRYTDRTRLEKFIERVNSTNPDLVLIGGDLITSTPDYINLAAEMVGNIKSKYGVYSCVGDHDHWSYRDDTQKSVREMTEALAKHNVVMIDNDKLDLKIGNAIVRTTFVTYTYVNKIETDRLDSLLNEDQYDLKILLVHQPGEYLIQKAKEYDYDLFLAGHTHGGQVTFLFPFIKITPTMFETRYTRGDFYFDNMLMIVTRGLGMSLVPFRYNSTPEVTIIVLSNK